MEIEWNDSGIVEDELLRVIWEMELYEILFHFSISQIFGINKIAGTQQQIQSNNIFQSSKQDKCGNTQAMLQALKGEIPSQENYHNSSLKNKQGQTVALILASKGIIPPLEWNHKSDIQDNNCYKVEEYLQDYQLPVPNNWVRIPLKQKNKSQFQQAIYNEEITNKFIKPEEQNRDGFTIAMIQVINGKIPEERFIHDPCIKNIYGQTVEDIMIANNIEVPDCWKCKTVKQQEKKEQKQEQKQEDSKIQKVDENENKEQKDEVEQINKDDNKQQLSEQYTNPQKDNDGNTEAMKMAKNGIIPGEKYYHDPEIRDKDGHTVCYYLFIKGIRVPGKWQDRQYKKPFRYDYGEVEKYTHYYTEETGFKIYRGITYVMQYMIGHRYRPDQIVIYINDCYHDPNIKDGNGNTVEDYLKQGGITVPKQWKTY